MRHTLVDTTSHKRGIVVCIFRTFGNNKLVVFMSLLMEIIAALAAHKYRALSALHIVSFSNFPLDIGEP